MWRSDEGCSDGKHLLPPIIRLWVRVAGEKKGGIFLGGVKKKLCGEVFNFSNNFLWFLTNVKYRGICGAFGECKLFKVWEEDA